MQTSTQIRCRYGAGSRICITRAQKERSGGTQAAALGLPLLFVQNALADVPSLDDLQKLSYDSTVTPKVAVKAVTEASDAVSKLDAVSAQDAAPLIAGLAVGIAVVGGAIAYFSQPGGPRIQARSASKPCQICHCCAAGVPCGRYPEWDRHPSNTDQACADVEHACDSLPNSSLDLHNPATQKKIVVCAYHRTA